jgi:hypothetical protein
MSRGLQLRPEMGTAVIRYLSQFAELPKAGILAGQAVASAVDDLWGRKGSGVYNDLDVFRRVSPNWDIRQDRANQTADRRTMGAMRCSGDGYGAMSQMIELVEGYAIQSVNRQGMLNFVNCTLSHGLLDVGLTARRVIGSFDLNCVRVGVDLARGKLIWDRHFERFLGSRQIEITMVHTPWHTFLRLCKKLDELQGVYADVEAAAVICAGVTRSYCLSAMVREKNLSLQFGKKHVELAEKYRSLWAPYFDLESTTLLKTNSGWIDVLRKPEWMGAGEPGKEVTLWTMHPKGEIDRSMQQKLDRMGQAVVMMGPRVIYGERLTKKPNAAKKVAAVQEVLGSIQRAPLQEHVNLLGENFVSGQALPDVALRVNRFIADHSRLAGMMLGLTLADQQQTMERIKRVTKRFDGDASVGVIETMGCAQDLESDEALADLIELVRSKESLPMGLVPLVLPALPKGLRQFEVKELVTAWELRDEGVAMGHCVGGYASAIRSGRSRILRVRGSATDKRTWSTVQIARDRWDGQPSKQGGALKQWSVVQHKGRFNNPPPHENEALMRYLMAASRRSPASNWALSVGMTPVAVRVVAKLTKGVGDVAWAVATCAASISRATGTWSATWKKQLDVATADRQILRKLGDGTLLEAESED